MRSPETNPPQKAYPHGLTIAQGGSGQGGAREDPWTAKAERTSGTDCKKNVDCFGRDKETRDDHRFMTLVSRGATAIALS